MTDYDHPQRLIADDFTPSVQVSAKPSWTPGTLAITEAIRKHQPSLTVGLPEHVEGPSAYASYLDDLRQRYGHLISILAADIDFAIKGKAHHKHVTQHLARQA